MKFCKKYEEYYMKVQQSHHHRKKKLPAVGFRQLKKILKRCRNDVHHRPVLLLHDRQQHDSVDLVARESSKCPNHCPVCDGTFFPSLLNEMSEVVGFFNERARKLLEQNLPCGFTKCFTRLKEKLQGNHNALIQECRDLVTYAMINAVAMRKILKKYDKIHLSKQGQAFKSQAQTMHVEILQSPWLCELMALHMNTRSKSSKGGGRSDHHNIVPSILERCSLTFNDGKPSLACELPDSVKLDIDLTCSICLDILFDPVSLTCGHIFCYMCACKAASVTIVDGLKTSHPTEKCPICREEGVYERAMHLEELHVLLSRSCDEYWQERRKAEKRERIKQAKEHWEAQCRLFTGV